MELGEVVRRIKRRAGWQRVGLSLYPGNLRTTKSHRSQLKLVDQNQMVGALWDSRPSSRHNVSYQLFNPHRNCDAQAAVWLLSATERNVTHVGSLIPLKSGIASLFLRAKRRESPGLKWSHFGHILQNIRRYRTSCTAMDVSSSPDPVF